MDTNSHPIPQDVTGFQFKLIGAMTVKQFLYLAVPSVVAWVIYSAPFIIWFIKFPIILILAIGAVVMAFLPIEGRSADVMLKHFFHALFAPNQFIYQKTGQKLAFATLPTQSIQRKTTVNPLAQEEQRKTRQLQALLQSSQHEDALDDRESSFMQKVAALNPVAIATTPQVNENKGILSFHLPQIFSRPQTSRPVLSNFKMVDLGSHPTPAPDLQTPEQKQTDPKEPEPMQTVVPVSTQTAPLVTTPSITVPITPVTSPIAQFFISPQPITNPLIEGAVRTQVPVPTPYVKPTMPNVAPTTNPVLSVSSQQLNNLLVEKVRMEKELANLQTPPIKPPFSQAHVQPVVTASQVNQHANPLPTVQALPPAPVITSPIPATPAASPTSQQSVVTPVAAPQPSTPAQSIPLIPTAVEAPHIAKIPANMAKNMGLPSVPDTPNLITGLIRDPRGNVLPNILVEVKDKEGNPVRAFKTNQLGQFASATPLLNGIYSINFEDASGQHKFDTVEVTAKGTILLPISVVSHDAREELRKALFN